MISINQADKEKSRNSLNYSSDICVKVTPIGFEPMTRSLEGCCSIH